MRAGERFDYSGIPVGTRVYTSFTGFLGTPPGAGWIVLDEDACHYRLRSVVSETIARVPKKNVRITR